MNEIIADKKDVNNEIFFNQFKYQNPLFLLKDSITGKQGKNEKIVININDELIALSNNTNRKEIPANENQKKVVDIVEKMLNFNKQQKVK